MSRGKVEFVLTSEDAKAMAAATKLLAKVRELGDEYGKAGKHGQDSLDGIGEKIAGLAMKFAGPTAAIKGLNDLFDIMRQKVEAVQQAQEKAAQVSKTYGEAFGKIASNIPGMSANEASLIDTRLREIASSRAIGEGGLIKLADAYAQIQSAVPLAPQSAKFQAIDETAQLLELSPTENAPGIGLGISKIMEASEWKYDANQAQNLLRMQQTLGLVKEVAPIGQGIPRLGAAAKMGGETLADMQAFAAYMTQALGDTGGEESVTAIQQMVAQLMTRAGDVEAKIGIRPTGSFFNRFNQVRNHYAAGNITEDQLGDLFPIMSRGGMGKMAIMDLLDSGWNKLGQYRSIMTDPGIANGDFTESDIATVRNTLGPQEWQYRARHMQSLRESGKAGNEEAAREDFFRNAFEVTLHSEHRTARYIEHAMKSFDMIRQNGWALSEAISGARQVGEISEWPLIGSLWADSVTPMHLRMRMRTEANIEKRFGQQSPYRANESADMAYYLENMISLLQETRDAIREQTTSRTTPRSALSTGGHDQ
jgi:hypothetical protein